MAKELEFLTEEEEKMIMDMAGCNFTPSSIAKALDYSHKDFLQKWMDKRSAVRQAYDAGKLLADFQVINKQRELAESGNITAAQIFLKENKERDIANIRDKILKDDAN
jgi:hypothetical protein